MTPEEGIAACAGLVQRGDPPRFRAAMAAPVPLRRMLFPLYAFNLEVARAPLVTKEPMIAEMRLQWWRDALGEIAAGGQVRRHEVVTPLALALDAEGARDLDDLIEARRADIEGLRPAEPDDVTRYLDRTAGTLLWTAARLAGATDEDMARDGGLAQGLANWLLAVPDLVARNREPLPPGDPDARMRELAQTGLDALARARSARVATPARPVFLVLADTGARLRAIRRDPANPPRETPLRDRLRLGLRSLRGW
ncbi:squalene/phytoene synthase family protein [uncultured Jannaschia sp.]|uniref:squalene/phytoene synthase family protein n=1 Tax=uncultured Jannaschia sp. TaxID=293347 RepID=UPI002638810D|nr:squalene/phytoene synthase family protein [uncultured Jannaschia sp.]